jgi:hypothetical protein
VDVAKFAYRLSPENSFEDSIGSPFNITDINADIFLPFEQDDGDYIIAGSSYSRTSIDGLEVSSFALYGGVRNQWKKNDSTSWEYMTLIIPKINSDGGKIVSRDVQLGIYSLFYYKRRPDLKWKMGLYANDEMFGFLILPLFGVEWQIKESLKLDMTLPLSATLRHTVHDRLMLGFSYVGRKYSYNLARDREYLEVSDNSLSLFTDLYLSSKIVLNLQVGHSVLRGYDRYERGDQVDLSFGAVNWKDDRRPLNSDLSQGWIVKGGLLFRFSAH